MSRYDSALNLNQGVDLRLYTDDALGSWAGHLEGLDIRLQNLGRAGLSLSLESLRVALDNSDYVPGADKKLVHIDQGSIPMVGIDRQWSVAEIGQLSYSALQRVRLGAHVLIGVMGVNALAGDKDKADVTLPLPDRVGGGMRNVYRGGHFSAYHLGGVTPAGTFNGHEAHELVSEAVVFTQGERDQDFDTAGVTVRTLVEYGQRSRHATVRGWFNHDVGQLVVSGGITETSDELEVPVDMPEAVLFGEIGAVAYAMGGLNAR